MRPGRIFRCSYRAEMFEVVKGLEVHTHSVVGAKGLAAVWALARTVDKSILDAAAAEDVAARFDECVFETIFADLALEHRLQVQLASMWEPAV